MVYELAIEYLGGDKKYWVLLYIYKTKNHYSMVQLQLHYEHPACNIFYNLDSTTFFLNWTRSPGRSSFSGFEDEFHTTQSVFLGVVDSRLKDDSDVFWGGEVWVFGIFMPGMFPITCFLAGCPFSAARFFRRACLALCIPGMFIPGMLIPGMLSMLCF